MIAITNRLLCRRPLHEQVSLIAEAGAEMVILREKDLPDDEFRELAILCREACGDVPFSINSKVDVAREIGVSRVHLPMPVLRETDVSDFELVGASVHSVEEAVEAEKLGADYLIAGHVFTTACKQSDPRGVTFLESVCRSVDVPVYGIGGIGPDNVGMVRDAGAKGVCSMSGVMSVDDPGEVIRALSW